MSWLKALGLGLVLSCAITGIRGHGMARAMEGQYRLGDWAYDAALLFMAIALLRLLDALLSAATRRWLPGRLGQVAKAVVLIAFALPFLLATLQIHPPKIGATKTPADFDVDYEAVTFPSEGRALQGWFLPNSQAKADIIVAHGLNANRQNFLEPAMMMQRQGCNVFIFDFRGHGDSEGRQITLGLDEAKDLKAAHDWLAKRCPGLPVHGLGYSMGASAMLTAAARFGIFDRICVDATFASVRGVARASVLHWTGPFAEPIWQGGRFWIWVWTGADLEKHRPVDAIGRLDPKRLLIIHGTEDKVIPYSEGLALHAATGGKAGFWSVEGAGHAETVNNPDYETRLRTFFLPSSR